MSQNKFEQALWKSADKLRKNIDAAEYKHIVNGLIFLKYISLSFEDLYAKLEKEKDLGADPEDRDEYEAENVFFVPIDARWQYLKDNAASPTIGQMLDKAMEAIEKENDVLKNVLPKVYGRSNLDPVTITELINLISDIGLNEDVHKVKDLLGKVYEYFLGQFALAEGKNGGQFYTPESIVKLLVEILQPYEGRVFDPCCGSGGMFVQSKKFINAHTANISIEDAVRAQDRISIYGQESNQTTWRLARMNLAIRGINAEHIKWNTPGSFLQDAHPDLKADYIIANPPFNQSEWGQEQLSEDGRWQYGTPPKGNANFAWVQHFLYHLSPKGKVGFVLANGSLSSNINNEGEIRKRLVEADLVECIVMLPSQLFYNTGIPACLWFLKRGKERHQGEILFIDASEFGYMETRAQRALSEEDIDSIADIYNNWQNDDEYDDIKGLCKSVFKDDVVKHNYILTPGRYVGIPDEEDDGIPFEQKIQQLGDEFHQQNAKMAGLNVGIHKSLEKLGVKL